MHKETRVLIVDDEPRNLRILDETLDELCLLAEALDGEQALKQVTTFKPDLILLDGMMPGITGLEVCKQLKEDPLHRHIKIIFVTGQASGIERSRGIAAGADGYMIKPFEEDALLAEIDRVMV